MKTLKSQNNPLSQSARQLDMLNRDKLVPKFIEKLGNVGLYPLQPLSLDTLQVNVGYMCNQTCEHCHVDAGPDRKEIMSRENMQYCLNAIDRSKISTVDITGGAPEMNSDFMWFVEQLTQRDVKVIVRSNLTILVANKKFKKFPKFFKRHRIAVIASLPCYTEGNTDKQRGEGVFNKSIEALKLLNSFGYGKSGSGLELHLVYNPGGPSLPPPQQKLEADYKKELKENFNIDFNRLYTLTNLPVSRFLDYLLVIGKYEEYMEKLVSNFNPVAAEGVMCRNIISVGWDGTLYDCDFNQMLELKLENNVPGHIRDFNLEKLISRNIVTGQHCYGCTAGAGSSCQGAIT